MAEKVIKAILERGEDGGFVAYSNSVPGVYANGQTEEEVKEEFVLMMEEQAEFMKERTGELPEFAGAKVEFTYALSALFQAYPFLNASAFAKWIGINPSLMRKYKADISVPQGKNRELIQHGLASVAERLEEVLI